MTEFPLYCTSAGKVYLSCLTKPRRARLLSKIDLVSLTKNTITNIDELKRELNEVAKTGIGIDNEEFIQCMVCVAVPLKQQDDQLIGALAMHAPTARMNIETALQYIPRLRVAAEELMDLL